MIILKLWMDIYKICSLKYTKTVKMTVCLVRTEAKVKIKNIY